MRLSRVATARFRDESRRLVEGRTYLVKKLDQQETELEKLRKEIKVSKIAEGEQRREVQHSVMNLDAT
ncbi:MAG: hypothetical protein SGJ16_05785 [Nitrospirota bacterium]|nr:hypothetical protein [Nitrospirota bacterium]